MAVSLQAPEALSLLLLLGLYRRSPGAVLPHPLLPLLREAAREAKEPLPWLPPALFALGLLLLALAATKPLLLLPDRVSENAVILAVDVSRSMMATDLKPNRLEAAKGAARPSCGRPRGGFGWAWWPSAASPRPSIPPPPTAGASWRAWKAWSSAAPPPSGRGSWRPCGTSGRPGARGRSSSSPTAATAPG